jgi:hypothetical protein
MLLNWPAPAVLTRLRGLDSAARCAPRFDSLLHLALLSALKQIRRAMVGEMPLELLTSRLSSGAAGP